MKKYSLIEQRSALAWMLSQAKEIEPNLTKDVSVSDLAKIISLAITIPKKKRRVLHRKKCTCSVVDMGYTTVFQMTVDSDCHFHKHLIKDS